MDSLARAFDVSPPQQLDDYVAESVGQSLQILGVVFSSRFGAAGGFAKPVNAPVFSGIPSVAEDYRPALSHVVLLPIVQGCSTSLLASEGVPTWFGGTAGPDFRASVQHLASQLEAQPVLTLDMIVSDTGRDAPGA